MLILLLIPITFVMVWLLWVWITLWFNDVILPLLWWNEDDFISLWTGMIFATIALVIYFFLFTKTLESKKFKDYRDMNWDNLWK